MKSLLITFVKNPVLGTVKTRLASTLGDQRALNVYESLLAYTKSQIEQLTQDKAIYYNSFIETSDLWEDSVYIKNVQRGESLGDRIQGAFQEAFQKGYDEVILIGSDCFDITQAHIQEAFDSLKTKDIVIGPALDGGYYLIGMNKLHNELFINKSWSTSNLREETINSIQEKNLSCHFLEELNDIDTEEDLIKSGFKITN